MPYIGTSPSQGVRRVHTYTATANQTTFTGAGAEGATLSYKDSNFVDVYQNGVKLGDADYTATSGTSIVLGTGATVSDLVVIVAYDVFSAADTVSKADGGQFDSSISFATNANIDASSSEVAMGTFTVDGPIGLIKTNTELRFRDDAIKIQSSADGQLDIDADTEIEITTTTVDLNGALTISGDTTLEDGADLITASAGTSNFRAGVNAGNSIASGGNYNVVVGDEAGTALTTGDNNVAVGFEALKTEDANGQNVAIGYQASKLLNAGADAESVMVGALAGAAMTTGLYNVGIGRAALTAETQGDKSVAVGNGALGTQNGVDGDVFNTAVGHAAGGNITTAVHNTLIGGLAGDALTDGSANVAIGKDALSADTRGQNSVAIGRDALLTQNFTSATDSYNVAVGRGAGQSITTGIQNTLLGGLAGDVLTDADYNVAIGLSALGGDTKGNKSVAIGANALAVQNFTSSTDSNNTAVGYKAGNAVTNGSGNTFVGANSGDGTDDGSYNVAIGDSALSANCGNSNVAIGRLAGNALTGTDNTFVGEQAGASCVQTNSNTFIGEQAGSTMTTGSNNTILGGFDGNQSIIGDIRHLSNYVVISDGDGNSRLWITGGTNSNQLFSPAVYAWTTSNSANVIVTSSTGHLARSTSALKYKQDIRDLESIDIDKFRPVRYKSKCEVDDQTVDHFGIIADEVHDAGITELVQYGDKNEIEGFEYERLTAVLVKNLQEQKKTILALEARIKTLEG